MSNTHTQFTPGNKSNMNQYISNLNLYYNQHAVQYNKDIIRMQSNVVSGNPDYFCNCIQNKANQKQGYNNDAETQNERITRQINNSLGGRTTFGNNGVAYILNHLGGKEGQPGGIPRPLRNKF